MFRCPPVIKEMAPTIFSDIENSKASPVDQMLSKEFIDGMLKAGSMISMIENKKLNTAAFFALLLENKNYQEFFAEITSSNNFRDALLSMLYLNPSLVKSKVTKSTVRRIHNAKKSTQRPTKISAQKIS